MAAHKQVGLVLGSAIAPNHVPRLAALAEGSGFDEIWLAEDFFFTGGISGAALALGATTDLKVGLGVVSAVARHPALLAMEISTLTSIHPGRLIAGVGLGVPAWVRQMDLHPRSPLTALRETVQPVRELLQGETVNQEGEVWSYRDITLTYPESGSPTPLWLGVIGPNMLRLSGEIADGSILSVSASHAYVRWARERIDEGRTLAGRNDHHPVTVFALYAVDADGDAARASARSTLAFYRQNGANGLTDVYGISDEVNDMVGRGGYDTLVSEMPDQWVEDLTIAGTSAECAAKINGFYEAGADSVALFPVATDRLEEVVRLTADEVLPLV